MLGRLHRDEFVASYVLADGLGSHLRYSYPDVADIAVARQGLRQWLRLQITAQAALGLPSKAVDLLWEEFSHRTDEYRHFCEEAYGGLLHHTPSWAMPASDAEKADSTKMALTYALACRDEVMRPHYPDHVPLLFRVDTELAIVDGQHWVRSCGDHPCSAPAGTGCIEHGLFPLIPEHLPEQYRLSPNGQLVNVEDDLFKLGPKSAKSYTFGAGGFGVLR